jgi:hypothetical protein
MGGAAASRTGDDTGVMEPAEAQALEALRLDWGTTWDIGRGGACWRAARRDGTGHVLTRASADAWRSPCGSATGEPSGERAAHAAGRGRAAPSEVDRDGAGPAGSGTPALSASEAARMAGVSSLNGCHVLRHTADSAWLSAGSRWRKSLRSRATRKRSCYLRTRTSCPGMRTGPASSWCSSGPPPKPC